VSVIEPSDAINAGMAIQTGGRPLTLRASLRLQIFGWLVGLDFLATLTHEFLYDTIPMRWQ